MAEIAENKEVVIRLVDYLNENKEKVGMTFYAFCKKYGISRPNADYWKNKAPDVVKVLYLIKKETPEADILKALQQWQKPPFVLAFLRDFMTEYDVEFLELVKEQ